MMPGLLRKTRGTATNKRWDATRVAGVVVLLACLATVNAAAQDGREIPESEGGRYTLHVYEDLVQLPTLVLTSLHGTYGGLTAMDFSLTLDRGPRFHPRHVHVEGEDPITLSILLDGSGKTAAELLKGLDRAISRLPLDLLTERDHVSVYAFDCNLVRTTADQPANVAVMMAGVTGAMQSPTLHRNLKDGSPCGQVFHLWDAIAVVAGKMRELPGRRVMIVLSEGEDTGSSESWREVQRFVSGLSVAVFGLRPVKTSVTTTHINAFSTSEDLFSLMCAGTGGLPLYANKDTLGPELKRIIGFVRGRYILEFPRPARGTAGMHLIEVAIGDRRAIIRSSGVIFPVQDKKLLDDPSTVPTDSRQAPILGDRKILSPK